ncbi:MAG: hypothetical protein EOP76_02060 [Variovorax sp.]|jgi:hypothetical protein|nr:MAG: hypothetical protein EOP76_02060 [Variovorax sp.]
MSTQPDMWHGKPAREERTTSYQTLDVERPKAGTPMWIKAAVVVVIMFCFLLALKSLLRW